MAHEVPGSENFTGLSRKVVEYTEAFARLMTALKGGAEAPEELWTPLEEIIDVERFVRLGVFLTDEVETIDWATYREYITKYGGRASEWEATLRHLTEGPDRVIQELEERNTRKGVVHRANTLMAYGFGDEGRVVSLDVYTMPLPSRPVASYT
jgi:hypothetical protein